MIRAIILCGVFIRPWSYAAHAETLELSQVLQLAAKRPAARAAQHRARAASALATLERRQALLPSVAVQAQGTWRDRDLVLSTPIGDLDFGDRKNYSIGVRVQQPIFDPPRLLYTSRAKEEEARAAALGAQRNQEELARYAADRFFDILSLDAQIAATDGLIASLESRRKEIDQLVLVGRTVRADALRVDLSLSDARQARFKLTEARRIASYDLGRAVGRDTPIEPSTANLNASVPTTNARSAGPVSDGMAETVNNRRDVQALQARIAAVKSREKAVWAELLPRVDLQGEWIYNNGSPYSEKQWFVATVNLTWVPFASGTRPQARRALAQENAALERGYRETRRAIAVELRQAASNVRIAEAEKELAQKGVVQAREARRITADRYQTGRETINDLLTAEADLRNRVSRLKVAEIEIYRAQLHWAVAAGILNL